MLRFSDYGSPPSAASEAQTENARLIRAHELRIADMEHQAMQVRPERSIQRIHARGRMTPYERLLSLCDEGTSFYPLNALMGWDAPDDGHKPWQLGVLCAFCTVSRRQTIVIANDSTIAAGAWHDGTPQKIQRAQNMARRLRIPTVYLVECAGLYLPEQAKTFAGADGAGKIFEMQAELSRACIPQIAGIFGDCIAGGGYMPLLCDKIIMTEQASLCIGGSELNAHSKGGTCERLGSASVHVHQSGCADERADNDKEAIDRIRAWTAQLPSSCNAYFRIAEPVDPPYFIDDLYRIIPADPAMPFDMKEVIARLADGSQGQALMAQTGSGIEAVLALIDGLAVCFLATQPMPHTADGNLRAGGILYRDDIIKLERICACAHSDGIPIIWIQDISGFDIGADAERQGLLRFGAMLLRENASDAPETPPSMCIVLRKASGAGYYAMQGSPFHPAWIVGTAASRIEVMSPTTLADTLYDRKIAALSRMPDSKDKSTALAALLDARQKTIDAQTQNALAESAAIRGDIDTVIPFSHLRLAAIAFARAAYQSFSIPRKPRRLWSLLTLDEPR